MIVRNDKVHGCTHSCEVRKALRWAARIGQIMMICLALIISINNALFAGTFEVKPGGSINNMLKNLQPGDTLQVRTGTYYESLTLPRDGRPGQRLVLQAYPGEKPVIATPMTMLTLNRSYWLIKGLIFDHQNGEEDAIKISGSNNIIRGCEIKNGRRDAIDGSKASVNITIENCTIHDFVWEAGSDAHGIVVNAGARNWKILNNTIYNCGGDCIQIYASDETEVAAYAKNFTISGNIFYTRLGSSSENALDFKGIDSCLVEGNRMYGFDNKAWVIQKGCRNVTASNNIIHNSDRGIEARGEGGKLQENLQLIRNVVYNIREYALKFDGVINATVLHNTLANIGGDSFRIEGAGVQGGVFRNNLIYKSGSPSFKNSPPPRADHNGWFQAEAGDFRGIGDVTGDDPHFRDVANANFELRNTSPAKDAGIDVGLPYTGPKPDLGAYETGFTTPVKLNSLSVEPFEGAARLRWRTGSASDFSGFELERSSAGDDYRKLAFIAADAEITQEEEYEYLDRAPGVGWHHYRLKLVDLDGRFTYSDAVEIQLGPPAEFSLQQNYPNPFTLSATPSFTQIAFNLPEPAEIKITVHNLLGQIVRTLQDESLPVGRHVVSWDGRSDESSRVAAGVYVYRLTATKNGSNVWTMMRRMILIR